MLAAIAIPFVLTLLVGGRKLPGSGGLIPPDMPVPDVPTPGGT